MSKVLRSQWHPFRTRKPPCKVQTRTTNLKTAPAKAYTNFFRQPNELIKGAPPIAAYPGFLDFSENVDFGNFPVGFGVWGGLQSIGNGCGIQMDGFSAQTEPFVPKDRAIEIFSQMQAELPGFLLPKLVQERAGETSKSLIL